MWQELVITDLTRMSGDKVCIAGFTQHKRTVRPEMQRTLIRERHLFIDGRLIIRPCAVVRMDLAPVGNCDAPHLEDHHWIKPARTEFVMLTPPKVWRNVLSFTSFPSVRAIFDAPIYQSKFIKPGTGLRSLGTVKPATITGFRYERDRYEDKYRYRLDFEDGQGQIFEDLSVTDLALRNYCDHLRVDRRWSEERISNVLFYEHWTKHDVWLRIGLARPFSPKQGMEANCYIQVNGIYTFPDYLEGRCFADFPKKPPE